jgi:hypothetical protein
MNEGNGLDVNDAVAETMLLHWELDLGLGMAELSHASLLLGSLADSDRWKAHAVDALASAAASAARLGGVDVAAENRCMSWRFGYPRCSSV